MPGLLRIGSPAVPKGARIIELKFGDQKMHYCHNIPLKVMRDLILIYKSENPLEGMVGIKDCSPTVAEERSLYMMLINKKNNKSEDEWREHTFFQNNVLCEHLFEGFENYLEESLCEIYDGKGYVDGKLFEFHRTGIITTKSAMHQGLHVDDDMVCMINSLECFI